MAARSEWLVTRPGGFGGGVDPFSHSNRARNGLLGAFSGGVLLTRSSILAAVPLQIRASPRWRHHSIDERWTFWPIASRAPKVPPRWRTPRRQAGRVFLRLVREVPHARALNHLVKTPAVRGATLFEPA